MRGLSPSLMGNWLTKKYSRPIDGQIQAIERLRQEPSPELIRVQGGLWTARSTPRERARDGMFMIPEWSIHTSTVIALEAKGFLRESGSANGHPTYRLTTKGKRGRIRI